MKTLLLLICMLGLIPAIFAQKGDFAVTNQSDTVWRNTGPIFWESMRVRGVTGNQWCERIENGRIQLYSYMMNHRQNGGAGIH